MCIQPFIDVDMLMTMSKNTKTIFAYDAVYSWHFPKMLLK